MQKHWQKNQDNSFTFLVDGLETGRMNFLWNDLSKSASFNIGPDHYTITHKGFWSRTLFIYDHHGAELIKLSAAKWYANHWVLEYGGKIYTLSVRNNPLAEYVLADGEQELLAYGLTGNGGKIQVKITCSILESDPIFDFLLWYLFAPIAMEHMGDQLTFLLLIA